MNQKDQQIFLCQPNKVKIPAGLDVFTYGNTGYISIHSDDHRINIALAGNAAAVVIALRDAADELEKKLFLRQHREQTRRRQAIQSARAWDWLTPEMVVRYFEQSPILAPVAADVRDVLSKVFITPAETAPAPSQLELDLETVQSRLDKILANGRANKSEIARALNITPGGSTNWPRVTAVAQALDLSSSSSSSNGRAWRKTEPNNSEAEAAA
jgi:hypothetical protein